MILDPSLPLKIAARGCLFCLDQQANEGAERDRRLTAKAREQILTQCQNISDEVNL